MSQSKVIYQNSSNNEQMSELDKVVEQSEKYIYKVQSVFPWKLFPDSVIVDQVKIDLVYGLFFNSYDILPIVIQDITSVEISTGALFAELQFKVRDYKQNPKPITYLKKDEALRARKIITGLIICKKNGIDLSDVPHEDLDEKLEEIGSVDASALPS